MNVLVAFGILYKHSNGCDGSRGGFLSSSLPDCLGRDNEKIRIFGTSVNACCCACFDLPICERIKMTDAFEQRSVP